MHIVKTLYLADVGS